MLDHIVPTLVQILFFPFSVMVFGRLDRATATAAVVLSGLLFLPEITIFKIADAVPIDKDRIIYLGALFGMLVHQDRAFLASRPVMSIAAVLIPMMISNVLTWQANLDPLFSQGDLHIGLSYSWLIGESIDNFFKFALPFVIAKAAFVSYQDLRSLFYLLIGMAVFYTALILFEVAMAIPFHVFQIHERLYGISFRPLFRLGFTEPAVFLGSGHIVATFMAMAVIASTGLKKIGKPFAWLRVNKARVITSVGLLATFKVGAAFLGFGAVIIITVFKPRRIALIASFSALMICIYPAMQAYDLFPEDVLIELAKEYTNADRAKSFGGRFDEEEPRAGCVGRAIACRFWAFRPYSGSRS